MPHWAKTPGNRGITVATLKPSTDEVAPAIRSVTSGGVRVSPPILARLFPMPARADQAPERNPSEPEQAMVATLLRRLFR